MNCAKCGSSSIRKRGTRKNKQRYVCNQCGTYFSVALTSTQIESKTNPIIAILDIEVLPAISYHWGMWNQNLYQDQMIEDICFLSWAGKYLGSTEIKSDILTSREAISRDPKRITQSAWDFLSKADIVIGHNFAGYDQKILNNNFLLYTKPLGYKIIDTLSIAKSTFRFTSNKLSFINDKLGITNKIEHEGFNLWKKCSEGDKKSLQTMLEYNIGDVTATEELYLKLRPFIKNHPSLAVYSTEQDKVCPNCGGSVEEEGTLTTKTGMYTSYRCTSCGSLHRDKENLLDRDKRKNLLTI